MWRSVRALLLVLAVALPAAPLFAAGKGEGTDIEIGGPGDGRGKFGELADIAFDRDGYLYVLDGAKFDKTLKALVGNFLIQKFDSSGKFLSQFSIKDEKLAGEAGEPARLAVDGRGRSLVTFPRANLVRQFGPDGAPMKDYAVPGAYAVAVRKVAGKEEVVVIGRPGKRQDEPAAEARIIQADGGMKTLALSRPLVRIADLAADAAGNLYAVADVNQIYKYEVSGKLLSVIGGGTKLRLEDGSELLHTVTLDSKGNIYAMTWGNPGLITRFDPDLKTVARRKGQFSWADPWGIHSGYTPFAIGPDDRLWIGTVGKNDGKERGHYRPCVLRTVADFIDPASKQVAVSSTRILGLNLAVEVKLPYNVAYELAPVAADFIVKAGTRQIADLSVTWRAVDAYNHEAGRGSFALRLTNGEESRQAVSFTPPRWGWYSLQFEVSSGGERLAGLAAHVGVTPKFPGMPVLAEGESPGGWEDAPRQAFAGLRLMRIHPDPKNLDKCEATVAAAAKYGCTLIAQFQDAKHCTPEFVREVVTRFKGRVRYWEIMNEPNFAFKPPEYAAVLRQLYPIIKGLDPAAQVLAPTVCGVQLPWHEEFYKSGGQGCFDILSIHDYEGHESIDPVHWAWKLGELRKLMAAHCDAAKAVWQTERAITGIRGRAFLGVCQAVRITLHEDLLASLGIPAEHNLHYYLNEGGYSAVPSYLWSSAGPHPGALAARTRQAMIDGRSLAAVLDFGPTGHKIFMGLHYKGDDGSTVILRNLGAPEMPVELAVAGGDTLETVDAWGNSQQVAVKAGRATLPVSAVPTYLRLAKGQEVAPPRIDFGPNLAAGAEFTYSGSSASDMAILNDGIFQTIHAGNPDGGTDGKMIWQGDLLTLPQTLQVTLPRPRAVGRIIVFSVGPDNQFCALLDYDVECHDGKGWLTACKVRAPLPEGDAVQTPLCKAMSWEQDPNLSVAEFPPVTTDRLRLVVYRTTFGFYADDAARKACGSNMEGKLMLREVEIYGPPAR